MISAEAHSISGDMLSGPDDRPSFSLEIAFLIEASSGGGMGSAISGGRGLDHGFSDGGWFRALLK
jgi:hypothetical protein